MNSFFSQLFELFFRKSGDITTDLYDNFLYGNVGIVMCVSSILVCAAFYFLMNHARYAKVSTWLLMFLVNFLVVFLFALFFPKRTLLIFCLCGKFLGNVAILYLFPDFQAF
jgi:hypothetical protein